MVQANELRIGNWYSKFGLPKKATGGFIQRLSHIQSLNKNAIDVSGIPLTPEILEKAGFKYDEGMESYDLFTSSGLISIAKDYSFFIGDNHFECGFAGGNKSLVKYLHQLQNLYFALTGEELQINL